MKRVVRKLFRRAGALLLAAFVFVSTALVGGGGQRPAASPAEPLASQSSGGSGPPVRLASQPRIDAVVKEVMQMSMTTHGATVLVWLPTEYFEVSAATMKAEGKATAAQVEEATAAFLKLFGPYTIVAVVDGKGELGNLVYVSDAAIRATLRLVDAEGVSYAALDETAINSSTRTFLSRMRPMLAKMFSELGPFGENFHLLVFPAAGKSGRRIADPKSEGLFSIRLGDNVFKWRTPIGALLLPKRCPADGEMVNGAWKFCPWHGARLVDTD